MAMAAKPDDPGGGRDLRDDEHPAKEFDFGHYRPRRRSLPSPCGRAATASRLRFVPGRQSGRGRWGDRRRRRRREPRPGWGGNSGCRRARAGSVVRARQTATGTSGWSAPATVGTIPWNIPAGPPRPQSIQRLSLSAGRGPVSEPAPWLGRVDPAVAGAAASRMRSGARCCRLRRERCAGPRPGRARCCAVGVCRPEPAGTHVTVPPRPHRCRRSTGYEGGTRIVVRDIVNGARFTIERGGVVQGTWSGWGGRSYIDLPPAFSAGETLKVTQRMCPGDPPSPPGTTVIEPCSALPAPTAEPIEDGDTQVVLTSWAAGASIKVYRNFVKVGEGGPPVVALTQTIQHGDTVHIRESVGTCGNRSREIGVHCAVGNPSDRSLPRRYTIRLPVLGEARREGTVFYPADRSRDAVQHQACRPRTRPDRLHRSRQPRGLVRPQRSNQRVVLHGAGLDRDPEPCRLRLLPASAGADGDRRGWCVLQPLELPQLDDRHHPPAGRGRDRLDFTSVMRMPVVIRSLAESSISRALA